MATLGIVSQILASALLGAMVFFVAVVTTTVFKALDDAAARSFLRTLFPRFYFFGVCVAALSSALAMPQAPLMGGLMLSVAFGFMWSRQSLMPRINEARDAGQAGDADASRLFDKLHRLSVRIFGLQALTILGVLIGFSWSS